MVNRPTSLKEALKLLNQKQYTIMAGGTDLMVQKRSWSSTAPDFKLPTLFIKALHQDLAYIKKQENTIKIGALTTLEMCLQSDLIPSIYKDALKEMASINIRNEATIAGNIENASPAGDSLPVLYALDAKITLQSVEGKRTVALCDYIIGVRKTIRKHNEMITEIEFETPNYSIHKWLKVGGRRADAISKVSFVGLALVKNDIVHEFKIALGAVSPTVLRSKEIEKTVISQDIKTVKENVDLIVEQYEPYIQPIDDQRSNKAYRKDVAKNMIKNFVGML
jgi:CO/xanthine dehydrogenase FAD-binding subunit